MAAAPTKASAKTTLRWGTIEVPIGLFKTTADPAKELKFEQGGPNGGRLVTRAAQAPAEQQPQGSDPLALDPGPEADRPPVEEPGATAAGGGAGTVTQAPVAVPVLVEEGTEQVVEKDDVRRGVWRVLAADEEGNTTDEEFIDCTRQLEHIEAITALELMDIQGAVDIGRVPRERVIGSYYVGTDGEGAPKVLGLLCQAMIDTRRALVVKWTKTRRQATGVLVPSRRQDKPTIVLLQLAWPEDWRDVPKRADLTGAGELCSPAEFEKATELVRAMADSSALLEEQRDDALAKREEVHQLALTGRIGDFEMPEQPEPPSVLDSLEASLDAQLARV